MFEFLFSRKQVIVRRGGSLSDEELRRALEGRGEGPELRGVMELIGRLEDEMLEATRARGVSERGKLDLLAGIDTLRELAGQVADWGNKAKR